MIFSNILLAAALLFARGLATEATPDITEYSFDNCAGSEQVPVTEALRVGGHVVNVTIPGCIDFVPKLHPIDLSDSLLARRSFAALQRRNIESANLPVERRDIESVKPPIKTRAVKASPSECTNPNICQCGVACAVTCETFSTTNPAPTVGDCDSLVAVLRIFHEAVGNTFIQGLGFPNPIEIAYSTCAVAFGNIRTDNQLVEYCWDGLADNVATLTSACVAPGVSLGGICHATTNLYEMSIQGVDRH